MKFPCCSIEPLEARIAPAFAASVDLGSLDGHSGFKLNGESLLNQAGFSVSGAGDVNGDGFGDVVVGTGRAGAAYVVFGKAGGFTSKLDLSMLNGFNGFKLRDLTSDETAGRSVRGAGDVNGDGFADMIIGAPLADPLGDGNDDNGAAYVVFGKAAGFAAKIDLTTLDGSNGFRLTGAHRVDLAGWSVSDAGDVNGDGFADVVVGAVAAAPHGLESGAAFVVFGKAGGFAANLELSALDGSNGFKVSGVAERDYAGDSVSAAGDINGDGFADVIIGAPNADPNGSKSGAAYVIFGKATGFAPNLELSELDGSNGFKLSGVAANDHTGLSVSGAGDINGDGFADMLVGASYSSPRGLYSGAAYVIFGKAGAFTASLELSALDGSCGFKISGVKAYDATGHSVSGAGDVNGDGFADLLVSVDGADVNGSVSGGAYVIFGKAAGFTVDFDPASLDGSNGFQINGEAAFDTAGRSLSGAGDVNGDGFADIIIGAFGADPHGDYSGAAYVVFGGDPARLQIAADGHSATFGDIDGDLVTVTTTTGTFSKAMFDLRAEGLGFQLEKLDLTNPAFAGAKLKFTATPHNADGMPGDEGNGLVNLGYLDATGVALGKVKFPGDIGQIDAGAVQVLNLGSLGALGTTTQDPAAPSLHSDLTGNLGKLKIHGNLSGATFAVAGKIGPVRIAGDVDDATITALGTLAPANALDAVAIASVSIGGHVANSQILAGYDLTGAALNADVSIGKIIVKGNWLASSLAAGIADSTQDGFGQNDILIPGGSAAIIAKIAGITIRGTATGSAAGGDFFGLTAEFIKKAKINGLALALTPNKDDLALDAANNDFRLVEV